MQRLRRLWLDFARRYRGWYLLGLLCLLGTNLLTVALPAFVQGAVDALEAGRGGRGALPWAAAILGGGLAIIGVRTLSRTLFFNPGRTVEFSVKAALFERLLSLPRRYFDEHKAGDLISRGTNDTNSLRSLVGFASLQLFNTLFILLLTLGRMAQLDWRLTLLCVLPLSLSAVAMSYAVRRMFALYTDLLAQLGVLSEHILESYGGVAVLHAYDALDGVMARFEVHNERLLALSEGLLVLRSWLLPVVSVVGKLCVVIVLYVGGGAVVEGRLSLGALAAFVVYVNVLASGLMSLGWLVGSVQRGYLALGRVYEVLEAPDERGRGTATLPPAPPAGHGVVVEGLSYTHPGAEAPALRDLSFEIHPGETLGIFGLTGAGKSTLLDLLARIYDPPAGAVRISGVDATALAPADYWRSVAYVPQEPFLFSQSVRQNVALGVPPGAIDEGRLDAAVRDAALADEVARFPEGLDTVVGERGVTLSGGQRQRTALARAFYRDFDLLLLDDVLSAVDHATERALIEALYRRTEGRTTVIVSHRLSVLARADRVLVLDGGALVQQGPHGVLLGEPGPYAQAWALQRAAETLEGAGDGR